MNRKKLLISLAMAMLSMAGLAADNLPALRVQGKNLVDANGKTVVLHGVMDTPNRYFNGNRWGMGGHEVGEVVEFQFVVTARDDGITASLDGYHVVWVVTSDLHKIR